MLLFNPQPVPIWLPAGAGVADGALIYFYAGGTTTPLVVYTTDDGAAPHTNPVVADANGIFPPIFIPYGTYGYRITASNGAQIGPFVQLVQNPAPPDSGGGGGIVVTADQIFQTGFTMWTLSTGTLSGWVTMNDGTIGSAGSGATLRANADTQGLFTWLFDNVSDAYATVAGSRTTAAADFAANKTIVVPTMQGYLAGGLDTMGGSAANRIQVSTTISTTNLNTAATVASATGLCIGMYVVSANVPAGTTITAISGTALTLSAQASATAGGTAARFSMFTDAQVVGAVGGAISKVQALAELAAHNHGGVTTDNGQHQHGVAAAVEDGGTGANSAGGVKSATNNNLNTQPAGLHNHSIPSAGSSLAMSILNPMRVGTWRMKL